MNILTILLRELRMQGRRIGTYLMRVAIAGPALLLCLGDLLSGNPNSSDTLAGTSRILMVLFCFGAGLTISDAVGSERRRGTLGLLMLTPLRPAQILLGKAACQATHYLLCLVAAVPVIALPLLSGGITWQEVVMQCVNLLAATLLGLSAGLLATTCFRQPWAALGSCLLVLLALFLGPPALRYYDMVVNPSRQAWIWNGPLGLPTAAYPEWGGVPTGPLLDSGWWSHLIPTLTTGAALFVLALLIFGLQRRFERNPSRLPRKESRTGAPEPEPPNWVYPTIRRRRLQLPEGRNPCEELASAYAGNPLVSRMILMFLGGLFLLIHCFSRFEDDFVYLSPLCVIILFLIEVTVRWSLAAEIPRQYEQERNGGTLELVLGSSLSAGQVARGLARATIRTHLWKIGLLVVCHLLLLPAAEDDSLLRFHLGSLLLICLEAHAIHMVAASLALRGCNRIPATLGLFGIYCLPLAAQFLLPRLSSPVSFEILLDFLPGLRLVCALLGSLFVLDLRRIRRIFDDPDYRGPIGFLLPRRARTART